MVFSRNGAVMTETLEPVTKKKPEPTAEQAAAEELARRAREQGLSLTGPDGLANVARFHQAALSHPTPRYGLPLGLHAPARVPGVAVTPVPLPRDTDIALLRDWVAVVRG
jgi:hypothetical protein